MRYGSVCSGIEAASLAWESLDWVPAWFSEIEPFPSAVLAHHWPAITNLGDMTKIAELVRSGKVEAPDILVGGTPCQAFSVAGLRNGLADTRGQLTLSYVELADAIDDTRRQRGEKESIIVWENVPGVLSSKDNAFGCFLAGLAGESCELQPAGGKWTNSGYVLGPQRTVAWRILDAQYFGVAQRRRRVFVVASARKGFDPREVLFESEGVRRDTPPSREAGKEATATSRSRVKIGSHWDSELNPHPTLNQSHNTGGIGASNQELFSQRGAGIVSTLTASGVGACGADDNQAQAGHLTPDTVGALDTECGFSKATHQSINAGHLITQRAFRMTAFGEYADDETGSTCKARDWKDATDLAVCVTGDIPHTQKAEGFDGSEDGTGRGQTIVTAFNWQAGGNTSATLGADEHVTGALQCRQTPAIAFSSKDHGGDATEELSPTLRAGSHATSHANAGAPPAVAYSAAFAFQERGREGGRSLETNGDLAYALTAPTGGSRGQERNICDFRTMAVRRLTPRECERLQGMPDDHTLIPYGRAIRPEKMAEDYAKYLMRGGRAKSFEDCRAAATDGPRYKAIGNSMAINVMHWLGQRIAATLPPPLYDVIYADPPWQYGSKPNRGVSLEYPTMSLTELCTMQVKSIASPNAALFMWVTGAMVSEALIVGAAWGFKFIRIDKVWEKKKHTGSRHGVVGPWGMNDAEFLLLFTRGKVCGNQTERNQYTVYEEKYTGIHSGKPHFFREQIERRFKNARRIELFARTSSTSWDVWGNQAPNATRLTLIEPEGIL